MVHAVEALLDPQLAAMRPSRSIDPCSFIHSRTLHDERVIVLPLANRIPEPPWFGILGEFSPVRPDHSPDLAVFVQEQDLFGRLKNLSRSQFKEVLARKSLRITMPGGII